MSDIVERLSSRAIAHQTVYDDDRSDKELLMEAAAELTRLRTELAKVRLVAHERKIKWEVAEESSLARLELLEKTEAERDTLRQQLAVAREGLEFYATNYGDAGMHARDTLAKLAAGKAGEEG